MWRLTFAALVTGFLLNLTGWAGNVFLLGSMWGQAVTLAPPPILFRALGTKAERLAQVVHTVFACKYELRDLVW